MKILVNGEIRFVDLSKMSPADLVELKDELQNDLTQINIQLDTARANVHTNGEYADAGWYAKAMTARRLKGQQLQRIQDELGKRRKQSNGSVDRAFVEIARVRLHPDTFQDFMNEANNRVREAL